MFVWGGTVGVGTVGSDHCNTVKGLTIILCNHKYQTGVED